MNSKKPLGTKSYGSIPHLPGSRLGPGDYHIHEGQARIATENVRDKHDRIIVQEKLDGSNVGVAKLNGEIIALTRSGYLASTSPYVQHHYFSEWVRQNKKLFITVLNEGERVCGEWLAQAHGTRYDLTHSPFVAFDIITGKERLIYDDFLSRVWDYLIIPGTISIGPTSIATVLSIIDKGSKHGAVDEVEGAIWRVERKGKVDFLTKFVRHDKLDGKYLPEFNGTGREIWNIDVLKFKTGHE